MHIWVEKKHVPYMCKENSIRNKYSFYRRCYQLKLLSCTNQCTCGPCVLASRKIKREPSLWRDTSTFLYIVKSRVCLLLRISIGMYIYLLLGIRLASPGQTGHTDLIFSKQCMLHRCWPDWPNYIACVFTK